MNSDQFNLNSRLIKIGVITLTVGIVANFIPVAYLWMAYGEIPPFQDILKIWTIALVTFGVSWLVQPITFFSLLGTSGSYIGWLAGSVADIRCPAVTMAQKVTGYEAGTPEGEVISTMGIAGSILVSLSLITVFTIIGANIIDILPPFIKESFKVILPAVFGAVYVELASKHLKMGAATILAALGLSFLAIQWGVPGWVLNIAIIGAGIVIARIQYLSEVKRSESGTNA
ncbi:hypothetical protein [Acetonema longum]|uniref:Uncharacterized protein n=1 Tax=Acetonema longum DSM 6540 TaxID=1009370 RepID=F7NKP2_9FIRM|nr:hypothetical protein [Acetonema longum]EGO63346.1 hypothetical protein ALO_13304 [Acetonema longum DSM 6540]